MPNGNAANGIFKLTAAVLATALISVIGTWLATDSEALTREEVERVVATQSPYLPDREMLRGLRIDVRDIQSTLAHIREDLASLRAEVRRGQQ